LTMTAGEYVVDAVNVSQVPDPICAPNGSGATAGEWYKYTDTQDYYVTVTTDLAINLGKDTRVHIYSGDCNNLTCVAGNDDTPNNYLSHRSEEHTSELQSRENLVCRLLLEKK